MKRYEALFILNTAGKEDSVQALVDHIRKDLESIGCKLETVQKMDKKTFARMAGKKQTSGFYVNYIFEADAPALAQVRSKFAMNDDVFRVLLTLSPVVVKPAATAQPA